MTNKIMVDRAIIEQAAEFIRMDAIIKGEWKPLARETYDSLRATLDAPRLEVAVDPRQPLTKERLREMHHEDQFGLFCDYAEFEQIARAIEQAHGIKAQTALAAPKQEPPKQDLMKWAKDLGSSPEDLERFATYTITTKDFEIATLREENEALRRDAERYRWLRDNARGRTVSMSALYWELDQGKCDAAIDAAMKENKR